MTKQTIRMIAIDMDFTLLNDCKQITPVCMQAIGFAAEHGVEIVPDTGRAPRSLPQELLKMPEIRYAITMNGARIERLHPDKQVLVQNTIPYDTALALADLLRSEDTSLTYFIDGIPYINRSDYPKIRNFVRPEDIRYMMESRTPTDSIDEELRRSPDGLYKISLLTPRSADTGSIRRRILRHFPSVNAAESNRVIEITEKTADKGRALLQLASMLGIAPAETAAIGDSNNDLSMIQAAGCGAAMQNASADIKKASDFITESDNNNGGAAEAIYHLLRL